MKTITEQMAEIVKQAENLKKLADEMIVPNKIWLPGVGIVKMWDVDNVKQK